MRSQMQQQLKLLTLLLTIIVLAGCTLLPVSVKTNPTPFVATAIAITPQLAVATPHRDATPRPVSPTPAVVRIKGYPAVAVSALPDEAQYTLKLIAHGGPFPYRQDGAIFQNRERRLPRHPSGYYHEYTVETPGSADRGARRLITGEEGEIFYTDDHYNTFVQVLPT